MGHNEDSESDEQRAWRNFLLAHTRVLARMDADLIAECDMTLAEYEVLLHLYEAPGNRLRMNELAELARLSPSGLTRRFDALVRRGWVARERFDEDRRGVLAQLTAEGLERIDAARPVQASGQRRHFGDVLGRDELVLVADAMARLASANDRSTSVLVDG
jgi:DNA-binding MarR family transcriptional regulator